MSTATAIRFNSDEKELISAYAKIKGSNFSEVVRSAILEKIADEYDLKLAEDSYWQWEQDGKKSRPIAELWGELDL